MNQRTPGAWMIHAEGTREEMIEGNWTPSLNLLGQSLHYLLALSFPLMAESLGFPWYYGATAIMIPAILKTFVWNSRVQGETLRNEVMSMGFYIFGLGSSMALVKARNYYSLENKS